MDPGGGEAGGESGSGEQALRSRSSAGQPRPPPAAQAFGSGPGRLGHDRQPGLQGAQDGNRCGGEPVHTFPARAWGRASGRWRGAGSARHRWRHWGLHPRRWSSSPGSCPCSWPWWWTTTPSTWTRSCLLRTGLRSRTPTCCRRRSLSMREGRGVTLRTPWEASGQRSLLSVLAGQVPAGAAHGL